MELFGDSGHRVHRFHFVVCSAPRQSQQHRADPVAVGQLGLRLTPGLPASGRSEVSDQPSGLASWIASRSREAFWRSCESVTLHNCIQVPAAAAAGSEEAGAGDWYPGGNVVTLLPSPGDWVVSGWLPNRVRGAGVSAPYSLGWGGGGSF